MNKFITFEGCEASGKTTQADLLYQALKAVYNKVTLTREPGGTKEAEEIRKLLINKDYEWHYRSEILLHMAARNEHLQNLILPDLRDDFFVICDRYIDSTIAYQGYGLGAKITVIEDIYEIIAGDFMPSLTFILDIEPSLSSERLKLKNSTYDRYESMDREFHYEVRNGFLDIANHNPKRCVIIDASQSLEEVHHQIILAVKDVYELTNLIPLSLNLHS
jgi:dTMP kinase